MDRSIASTLVALAALAACGKPAETTTAAAEPAAAPTAVATPVPSVAAAAPATPIPAASSTAIRTCAAEIGASAAAKRVAICRDVSPATHPPCNAANSCAMIEDEIARSCALFDGEGTPMAGCTPAPRSIAAAAAVVRRYYAAIDARDYGTAWTQWGDDGRPGQTYAAFVAGFARTRATHVTIGAMQPGDGGAGSIYQPVPVTVDATLTDGTHQRFTGSYTIRRVNGVDGATPAQLRWHIDSAKLTPVK